jgi:hypothetical protein
MKTLAQKKRALHRGLQKARRGVKFDDLPTEEQLAVFQALQWMVWVKTILPRREAAKKKREAEKKLRWRSA